MVHVQFSGMAGGRTKDQNIQPFRGFGFPKQAETPTVDLICQWSITIYNNNNNKVIFIVNPYILFMSISTHLLSSPSVLWWMNHWNGMKWTVFVKQNADKDGEITYLEKSVPQSHLYSLVPQILEWAFQSDWTAYRLEHFSHFHFLSPCFLE